MLSDESKEIIKKAIALIETGTEMFSCIAIVKASSPNSALSASVRRAYAEFYGLGQYVSWPGLFFSNEGIKQQRLIMLELFLEANS